MERCTLENNGFVGVYFQRIVHQQKAAEKKYPKECEEARQDSIKLILKFLDEWGNRSC